MPESKPATSAAVVRQALSFTRPDRLPVFDGFWGEFADNWRALRQPPAGVSIDEYYGTDLRVLVANETLFPTRIGVVRRDGDDVYRDDGWGRIIRTREGTFFSEAADRVLNAKSDLDRIVFDPPSLESRYAGFAAQADAHRARGLAVFVKIGGLFIRTSFFRGEAEFLMDLAEDEAYAKALVERMGAHLLEIGLESLRRARTHDFGVWIYDDMCSAYSPMFSPATFERVFLPVYRHIIQTLKAAGARWVMLHCDGNLTPLLDLVLAAGFNGINPVEHGAGVDVTRLLPKYYGRLAFIGGVCNVHILPSGDADRIRRHVDAVVDAGRNGGLVIGTHSIGPDISVESYELYRRTAAERFAAL